MSRLKSDLEAAWGEVSRNAGMASTLRLTPELAAGLFIFAAGGNPRRALGMLPRDGGFWAVVRIYLVDCVIEESAS